MLSYQVHDFGKPLAQVIRETPAPQGSEVLLKVSSCGVCHSDVHLHDGYFDLGGGKRVDLSRAILPARTLGHEIAGVVVALGPDVGEAQGVKVGDRRVIFPWIGCGQCSLCVAGQEHLCGAAQAIGVNRDGGFADHLLVPHPRVLLDFAPLAPEHAGTLACSGLTAYSALKKLGRLGVQDPLLIIGAGGVGLAGIHLALEVSGVAPIVVELDKSKWDLARAAGAADVIDPSADGALKALLKATAGGVAAAVDFVGAAGTFDFGVGALRKGGRLISVGLFGGATTIMPAMLSLKAISIIGSYVGSLQEMHELLTIARAGRMPAIPLTQQPLSQATQALDALREGHVHGRTILIP